MSGLPFSTMKALIVLPADSGLDSCATPAGTCHDSPGLYVFQSPSPCLTLKLPSTTEPYSSPKCVCAGVFAPAGHSILRRMNSLSGCPETGDLCKFTIFGADGCCAYADMLATLNA